MRLLELFDEWRIAKAPSLQSANEYRGAVGDFIDLVGDIAVVEINHDDLHEIDRGAYAALTPRDCEEIAAVFKRSVARRVDGRKRALLTKQVIDAHL